jgi:hypothetical protein
MKYSQNTSLHGWLWHKLSDFGSFVDHYPNHEMHFMVLEPNCTGRDEKFYSSPSIPYTILELSLKVTPCLWALVSPCNPLVHPQIECRLEMSQKKKKNLGTFQRNWVSIHKIARFYYDNKTRI